MGTLWPSLRHQSAAPLSCDERFLGCDQTGPATRQNRASVLARSLLTVGSMQKFSGEVRALPDPRNRSSLAVATGWLQGCCFQTEPAGPAPRASPDLFEPLAPSAGYRFDRALARLHPHGSTRRRSFGRGSGSPNLAGPVAALRTIASAILAQHRDRNVALCEVDVVTSRGCWGLTC
jgi:hypothetical protein